MSSRAVLASHLVGSGIEIGPGHQPFSLPSGAKALYVDRWTAAQNRELFPELPGAVFPEPDIVANVDTDGLKAIGSRTQDFAISSHMIEHVADPLGFLDEVHRVLRPGGIALLLLPDRRRTFDHARAPTPLACLVRDHAAGRTSPDDLHIADFLLGADHGVPFTMPDDPGERAVLFERHRQRSIHVHCWTEDEFPRVLRHCSKQLAHDWELVDELGVAEGGLEFGYVLRRAERHRPRRFDRQLWMSRNRRRLTVRRLGR